MLSGHRYIVITTLALWGCGNMQFPSIDTAGFLPVSSETQESVETSESVQTEEEINGQPIDEDEDGDRRSRRQARNDEDEEDEEEDRPRKRRRASRRDRDDDRQERRRARHDDDDRPARKVSQPVAKLDFGATCKTNNDCESRACFVGSGELGYCTKMCDSWSDCPSFWECKKPGNAPQRICMQDED